MENIIEWVKAILVALPIFVLGMIMLVGLILIGG